MNRKLAFYEIGNGKLALQMQKAFEHAQVTANQQGEKTSVTLKIIVFPSPDDQYGSVDYNIKESFPALKSIRYTTQLNSNGVVIADGKDKLDVLQEELDFNEPIQLNPKTGEVL